MKRNRGFSLLELLIVAAIILIIATIAIPSLLRSRKSANESAAVATLKMVNTAQVTYSSAGGGGLYADKAGLLAAGLNRLQPGDSEGGLWLYHRVVWQPVGLHGNRGRRFNERGPF